MANLNTVKIIAIKELRDAILNKWFWLYLAIFLLLSLGMARFGFTGLGNYGVTGFGRTAASLVNISMLIIPLMGLTLGAMSISGEREKGTLLYLLTHPVTEGEILFGKFIGLGVALITALAAGFGVTGLTIGLKGGASNIGGYMALTGIALLLAMSSLSIGMLISSLTSRGGTSIGTSVFIWLFMVFISDLGLLGMSLILKLNQKTLVFLSLINPSEVFKMFSIWAIRGGIDILGPAGVYMMREYGNSYVWILLTFLILWVIVPLITSYFLFKKKGALP